MTATMNGTAERINGQQLSAKRRVGKPAERSARSAANTARARKARLQVELWARRYVGTAIILSAGLNGYAATVESHSTTVFGMAAAAAISGVVPGLVWGLGQLAGWLVRAGWRHMALAAGLVGVGMLLLSVWHCSMAIAGLTGSSIVLAVLLAVGIDCGLVVSELAAILANEDE